MTILQRYKVKRLRDCRTSLLEIATPDLCYGAMEKWFVQNRGAVDAVHAYNTIIHRLIPYQTTTDADVLEAVRQEVVSILDNQISLADVEESVRPVFDELILKIRDTKLSALLSEFNAAKEAQPNLASMGLRTILCLIIQERAKILNASSSLAVRQDLALQPMLDEAIATGLFPEGHTKLLQAYRRQGLKRAF
jgi:hypothetical protein